MGDGHCNAAKYERVAQRASQRCIRRINVVGDFCGNKSQVVAGRRPDGFGDCDKAARHRFASACTARLFAASMAFTGGNNWVPHFSIFVLEPGICDFTIPRDPCQFAGMCRGDGTPLRRCQRHTANFWNRFFPRDLDDNTRCGGSVYSVPMVVGREKAERSLGWFVALRSGDQLLDAF